MAEVKRKSRVFDLSNFTYQKVEQTVQYEVLPLDAKLDTLLAAVGGEVGKLVEAFNLVAEIEAEKSCRVLAIESNPNFARSTKPIVQIVAALAPVYGGLDRSTPKEKKKEVRKAIYAFILSNEALRAQIIAACQGLPIEAEEEEEEEGEAETTS